MFNERANKLFEEGDRVLALDLPTLENGAEAKAMYDACLSRVEAAGLAFKMGTELGQWDNAVEEAVAIEKKSRRKK